MGFLRRAHTWPLFNFEGYGSLAWEKNRDFDMQCLGDQSCAVTRVVL
jgi:hypothetical protein